MTIREIESDVKEPVRILGIVVDSVSGSLLVQDIYDDVSNAKKIWVSFEQELDLGKKCLFVGHMKKETVDGEQRMLLDATIALDINGLDVDTYREAVEMESSIVNAVKS